MVFPWMDRFMALPGLTDEEKGIIYAKLIEETPQRQGEIFAPPVPAIVAGALRAKYLTAPTAADAGPLTVLLKKMIISQKRFERGIFASLWLTFWGDIASTVASETTEQFRKDLVAIYGDEIDKMNVHDAEKPLRCMVTNLRLPGEWITAGYLLGQKDRSKAHVFGFGDINDSRNGLLWNRAIDEAFCLFQIVFSWNADKNSFYIHILDKNLAAQKISGVKLRKPFNRNLDHFIDAHTKQVFDNMTFADLEGKLMVFNNLNRPFKRVLCVHAKLGIQKARLEGKLPPCLDLGKYDFDYWTESADSKVMQTFLTDSLAWVNEGKSDDDVDFDLEDLPSISSEGNSSHLELFVHSSNVY